MNHLKGFKAHFSILNSSTLYAGMIYLVNDNGVGRFVDY